MTDQNGSRGKRVESSMLDGLFGAPPELPPVDKRVCQECGRYYYEGFDTMDDWLIGRVRASVERKTEWVIRCPRHITVWTMRLVGRGNSTFQKRLAEDAKQRDLTKPVPDDPFLQPFPPQEQWSEHGG